uniref:Uncharacterized protein n=1 Tax=Rhizophora mucronata TaxID=61149 RepID=A0A2P2QWY1_RHIMU
MLNISLFHVVVVVVIVMLWHIITIFVTEKHVQLDVSSYEELIRSEFMNYSCLVLNFSCVSS